MNLKQRLRRLEIETEGFNGSAFQRWWHRNRETGEYPDHPRAAELIRALRGFLIQATLQTGSDSLQGLGFEPTPAEVEEAQAKLEAGEGP